MDPTNLTLPGALAYSIIGFAIVFLVLIILMVVINIMAAIMKRSKKQAAPAPAAASAAAAAAPAPQGKPAPGTAGELKLYGTPERDAAMIMAIVASKMNKPLNELRFKSIKEVK